MIAHRHKRDTSHTASYGTGDFMTRLAAREAALGLHIASTPDAPVIQELHKSIAATCDTVPDAAPAEPSGAGDAAALPGDIEIVPGSIGQYGQFVMVDRQWRETYGRLIRVCGEWQHGRHNEWWAFDEGEMRPVCQKCWPMTQGRR